MLEQGGQLVAGHDEAVVVGMAPTIAVRGSIRYLPSGTAPFAGGQACGPQVRDSPSCP